MKRQDHLWLKAGINMLLKYGSAEVPATVAPRVQWAAADELDMQTRVGRGTKPNQRRIVRVDAPQARRVA